MMEQMHMLHHLKNKKIETLIFNFNFAFQDTYLDASMLSL